jgi:DNA-binding HxlR family transcriptional regulator
LSAYTHVMNQHATTFCPAYRAIGVLQEKWVLHIVRALLSGNRGFNELARMVGGCNSATLTQRLEQLEHLGIISKATDREVTGKLARSIYSLSTSGRELQSVIDAIDAWGRAHLPEDPAGDARAVAECAGSEAEARPA